MSTDADTNKRHAARMAMWRVATTEGVAATALALTGLCALLAMSGCADPIRVDHAFGDAARQVAEAQRHPQVATAGAELPPEGLDGEKAGEVLKVYREDVTKAPSVQNEIHINVGN